VAYVRFASIYRDFGDLEEFARELRALKKAGAETT
jgi:transcriptional regulator NrdR family protein